MHHFSLFPGLGYKITILIAFTSLSCSLTSPIKKTEWLIGTWEQQTSRGNVYETWTQSDKNKLSAISYKLQDRDTLILETLQLRNEKRTLYYIPQVSDQNNGSPVRFTMTSLSDSMFVVENPGHDFPQKIAYQMINNDSLVAVISGEREGKMVQRAFRMRRVK